MRHGATPHNDSQPGSPASEGPNPIPLPSRVHWLGVGFLFAAAAAASIASGIGPSGGKFHVKSPPLALMVPADQVPGVLITVDPNLLRKPLSRSKLALTDSQKEILAEKLKEGRLRLGKIEVWDTVNEDGDQIRIEGVGFSQDVTILHRRQTFLVPFVPGGTIRISAIHDGDGGGVTLGVSTILGPTPLPSLAVGQTIEIPIL